MILAVIIRAVEIAGGAALRANHLVLQIVDGLDAGLIGDNDHLNAVGVGVGKVHIDQTVRIDGETGQDHIALPLLHGGQGRIKVHVRL